MPSPSKGDTGGTEGVTCRALGGDGHDTQTLSETEKKNSNIPLNPPEGEGEECDFDFWREHLNEHFCLPRSYRDRRTKRVRSQHIPQDKKVWPVLEKYLKAPAPEREDWEEQASLLRCRRKKHSFLSEVPARNGQCPTLACATLPEKKEPPPKPTIPEPEGDWRAVALELFILGEPRWEKHDRDAREMFENWPWQNLFYGDQLQIAEKCREKKRATQIYQTSGHDCSISARTARLVLV